MSAPVLPRLADGSRQEIGWHRDALVGRRSLELVCEALEDRLCGERVPVLGVVVSRVTEVPDRIHELVFGLCHREPLQSDRKVIHALTVRRAGTLGGAGPIAEHKRSSESRVKGGRRPLRSDAVGALDAGWRRPDARRSVRGRAEARRTNGDSAQRWVALGIARCPSIAAMGTWGIGPFDNDGAADLVADIRDGQFTFEGIQWAFEDPDYLEVDGGQIAIALGALIESVRKGQGLEGLDFDPPVFTDQITPERVTWVRSQIARTLAGDERSELHELWKESGDLEAWLEVSRAAMPSEG